MNRLGFGPLVGLCTLAAAFPAEGQPFEPTWESLDKRPTPEWFQQAKFGIFIHWGVYSVPAWGPKGRYAEWYWHDMQNRDGETWKYHVKIYGDRFEYQDFAPLFKAELFDAAQWADIFARSGAKYVVLTSKHHEGFCLWPSAESWNWNSVDVGPHRDLCGELSEAVRAQGLRMGFYYSLYEWFHPVYRSDLNRYVAEHMVPQLKDLVLRYKPELVWTDGEWDHPSATWRSTEFLAWLFNESPVRETVAVNDRWGKECRGRHGGFYTTEYGHGGEAASTEHPWEECRGIGKSFGYNRNETIDDYSSATELIQLLVSTVSRGGNLLLDIGPTADGRIPVIMQQRLLELGAWLEKNGESVYGTTAGPFQELPWGCSTQKPGRIFLHVFDWPAAATVTAAPQKSTGAATLETPKVEGAIRAAYLLADPERTPLTVTQHDDGVRIELPAIVPDPAATVIVFEIASGR